MSFRIALLFLLTSVPCFAKPIKAVTTIPDLAWIMQNLGDKELEATPLLTGKENPHYIDALPSYILKVADADIVCMVGLELEVGYIGPILSKSGNGKVQSHSPTYCDASKQVKVLEKATGPVDRSMGDVHPNGNPHYYLSPTAMIGAANEIAGVLGKYDPIKKPLYEKNFEAIKSKLSELVKSNKDKFKKVDLSKPFIIEYHREFSYFFDEYALKSFGTIEEKPGVSPSAGRIAEIAIAAKNAGVKVVLATDYSPAKVIKKFSEISGIPVLTVPTMVQPATKFDSYEKVQNYIVDELVKVLGQKHATR